MNWFTGKGITSKVPLCVYPLKNLLKKVLHQTH